MGTEKGSVAGWQKEWPNAVEALSSHWLCQHAPVVSYELSLRK